MPEVTGSNGAHYAAYTGNIETLLHILDNERGDMVHEPDGNGWLPIHEVRSCNVFVVVVMTQVSTSTSVDMRPFFPLTEKHFLSTASTGGKSRQY